MRAEGRWREGAVECSICTRGYGPSDIESGLYFLDAMVCSHCYAAMQRKPPEASCFGKPTQVRPMRILGYDPRAEECRALCPDRKACRLAVMGKR
jgi:hypothetical protein